MSCVAVGRCAGSLHRHECTTSLNACDAATFSCSMQHVVEHRQKDEHLPATGRGLIILWVRSGIRSTLLLPMAAAPP